MSELTPQHVLVDLFGSGDFPAEIIDPEHAAESSFNGSVTLDLKSSRRDNGVI